MRWWRRLSSRWPSDRRAYHDAPPIGVALNSITSVRAIEPALPTSRRRPPRILSKIATVIRQYLPMAPTLVRTALPPLRLDLRGEGRRLPHAGLQGRRPRPCGQPERRRPHPALPDVAAAVARLKPSTLVLDGELAEFDDQLRSRFEWFRDPDEAVVATPPVLIA